MKIVFVNRYYWPDQSATAQILTDLAEQLSKDGHEVAVITSRQLLEDPNASLPSKEVVNGVEIRRVATTTFGRTSLPGRAADYLSFYFTSAVTGLSLVQRRSVVVCKTDPPLIGLMFLPVVWLKRAKLINWWQDVYPEIAMHLGVINEKSLIYRTTRALRNWLYSRSDANVVIGRSMEDFFAKEVGYLQSTAVIPNWSRDLSTRVPRKQNTIRALINAGEKTVLGYSGNLGRAHDISPILKLSELLADDERFHFLLIGAGFNHAAVEAHALEKGLGNWSFLPYQPRAKLNESISAIDIHIVALRGELNGLIVPSKIYGALSAERPILYISTHSSEFQHLADEGTGIQVDGSEHKLLEAIEFISSDSRLASTGRISRQIFLASYTFERVTDQWRHLLNAI